MNTQIGFYFYTYYDYEKASDYFLKTSRILNVIETNEIIDIQDVLMKNAYFFQTIKEYDTSISYLKAAISITPKSDKNYGNFYNALGNCFYEIGKKNKALFYFEEAKSASKNINDTLRYAKVIGDIAKIYIDQNQLIKAENLLKEDIFLSEQIGNDKNLMFAKLRLTTIYLNQNKYKEAEVLLNEVQELTKNNENLKVFYFDALVMNLRVICYYKNTSEELIVRRKIDSLRPIIENIDGKDALNHVNWKIQSEKMQWKLETEHLKSQKVTFYFWIFILTSLVLLLIIILLFNIYKRRLKIQKITFDNTLLAKELDKIKAETALNEAYNSLKEIKTFLYKKNRKIIELEKSLKEIEKKSEIEFSEEKIELEKLISSHLMTDENWQTFKTTFIKEDPNFFKYLQNNFPDLTDSNMRIILLHKIGLNNKEIANLLGLTIHAIKKAKQRLRKKHGEMIEDLL